MGMDPASLALIGSALGVGADLYGANQQGSTNDRNFNASQDRYNNLQSSISRAYQPGMNPFSQAIMQFIGQGLPNGASVNGFNPGAANVGVMPTGGYTPQTGTGGDTGNPGGNGGGELYGAQYGGNLMPTGQGKLPGAVQTPTVPGYGGGWNPAYANAFPGIDPMSLRAGTTFQNLIDDGKITQDQALKFMGIPSDWASFNQDSLKPILNTNFSSDFLAKDQTGLQTALGATKQQGNTGYVNAQGQYVTPQSGSITLQNGIYVDQYGNPTTNPLDGSTGPVNSGGSSSSGSGNGMYRYQSQGAQTYTPSFIGSSQGTNVGQDSLMQMMRTPSALQLDPSLMPNLAQVNSGQTQFDNSDIFKALGIQQKQGVEDQVGQLHASAGSLGERMGSFMNRNEALLRNKLQNDINLQNAQIGQSSFEAAQARRLQGLGISAGLSTTAGQQQLSAAQTYAGNQQQLLTSNANIMNQAGQFNAAARTGENQFTASQGNTYNSMILQALAGAGNLQGQQTGNNTSLLGILGGVGVPQAQASPIPGALSDAASSLGFLPMILQMLGGSKNAANYTPVQQYSGQYGSNV